jgi:hypothetical protein
MASNHIKWGVNKRTTSLPRVVGPGWVKGAWQKGGSRAERNSLSRFKKSLPMAKTTRNFQLAAGL